MGLQVAGNVDGVVEELLKLPATTFCARTTGVHNLVCAIIAATAHEEHLSHITQTLWNVDGVQAVRIWPVVRVIAHHSDLVRLV